MSLCPIKKKKIVAIRKLINDSIVPSFHILIRTIDLKEYSCWPKPQRQLISPSPLHRFKSTTLPISDWISVVHRSLLGRQKHRHNACKDEQFQFLLRNGSAFLKGRFRPSVLVHPGGNDPPTFRLRGGYSSNWVMGAGSLFWRVHGLAHYSVCETGFLDSP